jgi:hypothetical protein
MHPHLAVPAGLPEEVRISSSALARGYALLALSSRDRAFSRCWAVPHHPDMPSADVHSVRGGAGCSAGLPAMQAAWCTPYGPLDGQLAPVQPCDGSCVTRVSGLSTFA